jgi:hypothetical protein
MSVRIVRAYLGVSAVTQIAVPSQYKLKFSSESFHKISEAGRVVGIDQKRKVMIAS